MIKNKLINIYNWIKNIICKWKIGGFSIKSVYDGHFNVTYRGIQTLKCPFDYVLYQMIVSKIQPDLVIEIGTSRGGSALYLADLMENIGHGTIHTIDINKCEVKHPRIKFFTDGWENYDLKNSDSFSKILVIDDASHSYEDVLSVMKKFSPKVSVGSYLIIEDGIVTKLGRSKSLNGGPLRAIKDFLKEDDSFVIDKDYCDFFGKDTTFNTDGYLKKIK